MNRRTLIIFRREYTQRLKSKAFIAATILGPVALAVAVLIPIVTTVLLEDDSLRTIYIMNEAGLPTDHFELPPDLEVVVSNLPEDTLKSMILSGRIEGYIHLPTGVLAGEQPVRYVSAGGGGLGFRSAMSQSIASLVREARLIEAGANREVLDIIESDVSIDSIRLTAEGEGSDTSGFLAVFGFLMAMIIYVCLFLYGSLVMRSVIEEKTSRIVEVIVSSVRPFELMLGKVLGVGALGLTQIMIWGAAFVALVSAGGILISTLAPQPGLAESVAGVEPPIGLLDFGLPKIPISFFVYFVAFFLGGYLLYASLFAAIGSVVEQESDAQQFMLPVAIPIIVSLLLLSRVVEAPDSSLSVIASHIPFFSPVLMPVRVLVSPPAFWEALLALLLLFATVGFTIWMCARIYRTGILMYGKRASLSDIVKWIRVA